MFSWVRIGAAYVQLNPIDYVEYSYLVIYLDVCKHWYSHPQRPQITIYSGS